MIPSYVIEEYRKFAEEEVKAMSTVMGSEYTIPRADYFYDMVDYLENNPQEFITIGQGNVTQHECDFIKFCSYIRKPFERLAIKYEIPACVWYLPKVQVKSSKSVHYIHKDVAKVIRYLFDESHEDDFITYRKYKPHHKHSKIGFWVKSQEAKPMMNSISKEFGIPKNELVKSKLRIFDDDFVSIQFRWMSEFIWIHNNLIEKFNE